MSTILPLMSETSLRRAQIAEYVLYGCFITSVAVGILAMSGIIPTISTAIISILVSGGSFLSFWLTKRVELVPTLFLTILPISVGIIGLLGAIEAGVIGCYLLLSIALYAIYLTCCDPLYY